MQCSAPLVGINIPGFFRDKFGALKLRKNTVISREEFLSRYRYKGYESYNESLGFFSSREDRGTDIFAGTSRTVTDSKGNFDVIFDAKYSFIDHLTGETISPYPVPCGTCVNCRLRRSGEWADRMTMENITSEKKSWFITLTYDDCHVPWNDNGDALTLSKDDVTRFRKNFEMYCFRHGIKPRHYIAGEYGSKTFRPHYHGILFNFDIPDIVPVGNNFRGDVFYSSDLINGWWKKGFVCIAECNWDTCAYTARYVTKKIYGKNSDMYEEAGILPEFQFQSNRPGIGYDFYNQNRDKIFADGCIVLPSGRVAHIPAYFDRLYENELSQIEDDSALPLAEAFVQSKLKRAQIARDGQLEKMHQASVPEGDYFKMLKANGKIANSKLIRSLDSIL